MKDIAKVVLSGLGVLFIFNKWLKPLIDKTEKKEVDNNSVEKIVSNEDSVKSTSNGLSASEEDIPLPSMWDTVPEDLLSIPQSTINKVELESFNLNVPDSSSKGKSSNSPYTSLIQEIYGTAIVKETRKWNGLRLKFTAVTDEAYNNFEKSLQNFFERNIS